MKESPVTLLQIIEAIAAYDRMDRHKRTKEANTAVDLLAKIGRAIHREKKGEK